MKRRVFLSGAAIAGGAAAMGARPREARAAAPAALLARAGGAVSARLVRYEGARPVESADVPLLPGVVARRTVGDATWSCALKLTPVKDPRAKAPRPDVVDLTATFKLERGAASDASVGLVLAFDDWSRGNYVLLPGACYAGNRFESRHLPYPPLLAEAADIGPNVPIIVSDIPRLNVHAGPSRLQVLAADLATPAVGLHVAARGTGLLALVDPATRVGLSGLAIEESDDRSRARVVLSAPGVREDVASTPGNARRPSKDRGASFRAGETLTLRARVLVFPSADVQGLFDKLAVVRKDLTGPTARPHDLPFSAAFKAHEARANKRWVEEPGYFAASLREAGAPVWQGGWCGGLAATLPLLAQGEPRSRERARQNLAFVLESAQAPSGFFHSMREGKAWIEDGAPRRPAAERPAAGRKNVRRWHLVRRSADTLTFALKQLALLERDREFKPSASWTRTLTRCADAFVRLWDCNKQLGQFVDVETGELVVGGSTSAGLAPAALALAGAVLKRDDCLAVAHAAAEQMFERYVRAGLTCGGPPDALQCPDGESAAALLESFVTLFELSGERAWLDRATAVAGQLSSWVISVDHPTGAPVAGAPRATGAMFSNAQNGRGTPGFTLLSGDALLRLYRATGETRHLELLRDTVHNLAQYLPRAEEAETALKPPVAAERAARRPRADTSDWLEPGDDLRPACGLFDAACLLSYSQIPGVYVRTTSRFAFAFDHVDARLEARPTGRLVLALSNPTSVEASVRVLAETDAEAARPLAPGTLLDARVVTVAPGGTAELELPVEAAAGDAAAAP